MAPVGYHRPATVAEAVTTFRARPAPRYLAGGLDLVLRLRARTIAPSDLIDLAHIPDLDAIAATDGGVRIGATARHDTVAGSPVVRARLPALAALAASIGDPQVRNQGTIAGALAVNDPAGDWPAAVLAFDAVVQTDRRALSAAAFLKGPGMTALAPDELITAVIFRSPAAAAYRKVTRQALRYALVGVVVARHADGVRVAVTGAAASAFRWTALEAALDQSFDSAVVADAALADGDLTDDQHGSAAYRAHLAGVLARRAVAAITPPQG